MSMIVSEIKQEIKELIELLDELILQENFNAYKRLRKMYVAVLEKIRKKNGSQINEKDFIEIQSAFRIFLEAPPKSEKMGERILELMDRIYQKQKLLLK